MRHWEHSFPWKRVIASGILLAGCCVPRRPASSPPTSLRLYIEPVSFQAPIRRLRYLESNVPALPMSEETDRINTDIKAIEGEIRSELTERLASSSYRVVSSSSEADLSAQIRVIAYGRVPGKWVAFLVGTGVVEAVVQGAVVEELTGNRWIALGVGGEELFSECVTWLGGAYVTNRYLTPMIFSCRVFTARNHRLIWHHDATSLYSHKIVAQMPKNMRQNRALQLKAVEKAVVDKLATALNRSASHLRRRIAS